jgi:hypothetical protein
MWFHICTTPVFQRIYFIFRVASFKMLASVLPDYVASHSRRLKTVTNVQCGFVFKNLNSTTLLPAWYTVLVFSKQEENCCNSLKLRQTKAKFSFDDKQRLKNLVAQLLLVMNNSGWQLIFHSLFMNWLSFHILKHSFVAQEKWSTISNDDKINITSKTLKSNLLLNLVFYPLFYTWPVSVASKQHKNLIIFAYWLEGQATTMCQKIITTCLWW